MLGVSEMVIKRVQEKIINLIFLTFAQWLNRYASAG